MEILTLKKIKAATILGVHPEEKKAPRDVYLSLELDLSKSDVFETGKLEDAIDYEELVRDLRAWLLENEWDLVETLADDVAKRIIDGGKTNHVKVTVEKPDVLEDVESVSVTVTQEYRSSKPMGFSGGMD